MKEEDFKSIVMPLRRQMYALCIVLLKDEEDAADCLQEVYTRLWQHRERLLTLDNPQGYCITATRRIAIDILRKRALQPPPDRAGEEERHKELPDPTPTPADMLETSDDLARLRRLLETLPTRQREVVEMSGIAGLSNSQIEQATGLSGDNVRVLLSRGRKKLRELFEKTR